MGSGRSEDGVFFLGEGGILGLRDIYIFFFNFFMKRYNNNNINIARFFNWN